MPVVNIIRSHDISSNFIALFENVRASRQVALLSVAHDQAVVCRPATNGKAERRGPNVCLEILVTKTDPSELSSGLVLFGAGPMALEYARVLDALGTPFQVVGRGGESANRFESVTGRSVIRGLSNYSATPETAIVAVSADQLATVALELIRRGTTRLLVEKPAGLHAEEIRELASVAAGQGASVHVAYNRRFYASTRSVREIVNEDGGVTSFTFEFTEWSHVIEKLDKPAHIKSAWLLGNSSHVLDLAFFLGGRPTKISCYAAGGVPWHSSASIFTGAGETDRGALFSFHANWSAPGRWGVEVLTAKRRLFLRPLEKLYIQEIGSVELKEHPIDDELDRKFKPGLMRLVDAFFAGRFDDLPSLDAHVKNVDIFEAIAGRSRMRSSHDNS